MLSSSVRAPLCRAAGQVQPRVPTDEKGVLVLCRDKVKDCRGDVLARLPATTRCFIEAGKLGCPSARIERCVPRRDPVAGEKVGDKRE